MLLGRSGSTYPIVIRIHGSPINADPCGSESTTLVFGNVIVNLCVVGCPRGTDSLKIYLNRSMKTFPVAHAVTRISNKKIETEI